MKRIRAGLGYGFGAYLIWGAFPFYFTLISVVHPLELVPWRVTSTLVFCAILVTFSSRWKQVFTIFNTPRLLGWFALSSLLLYANWQIFVIGVMTGQVLETSLGYFINPLFTIIIGVVVRGETLTRLQWLAVSIAATGVLIAAVAYGSFPWISLGLALSFGLYGAVRKQAGEQVDGITALTAETIISIPVVVAQFTVVATLFGLRLFENDPVLVILAFLSGILTATPLILFGEATRRLPLSYTGFLQFLTPVLSFLYGYFAMHEHVSLGRWIGFIGVWVALVILVSEMLRMNRTGLKES